MSRKKKLASVSSIVGIAVAAAGLFFVGRTLFSQWDETKELIANARWGWLAVAVPVCLAGMTAVGTGWRFVVQALGEQHSVRETLRWFFPGQLGKYIPGGIWPVVGRGELAVRGGVDRTVAYTSVALSLAVTYLGAALTALGLLAIAVVVGDELDGQLWVLLVLPVGLLMLHPKILRWLVTTAERVLSREMPLRVPDYATTVKLVVGHVPAWLLIGFGTWLTALAFDPSPPVAQVMFAAVLSWIVGFIVIPAPGGIGIREAAFVAAAVSLPSDTAAAVAIVARLCFIVADLIGAGLIMAVPSVSGTEPSSPSVPPDAHPSGS